MDGLFTKPTATKPLRPYQALAVDRLRASLASGHRRPVMMAPTGAGKTRTAAEIISLARSKGKRVAFTVPAISLVDQTIEALSAEGIRDVGVMQADHHMTDASQPVQVCSVQTIDRRGFPDCDIAIVDECHRMFRCVDRWMQERPSLPFVGLSATPWQSGMGAEGRYDDLIIVSTTRELIDLGFLCDFRVFAPSHPDLSGVKIIDTANGPDYQDKQLAEVMSDERLVGDVVETWLKLGEDRPTICFAVDCAHAQKIQWQFNEAGIACGYQDANTSDGERAILRDQFHAGKLKIVSNVGTLTTGVDWDVRCIILARPTKSEILFVQMIGRGLRTADGKTDCRIIDHSDTHLRLGFVTDIHHTELHDGSKKFEEKRSREPKPKLPKECPACHFLRPVGVHVCPQCGFAPALQSKIEHAAGDLGELRPKVNGKRVSESTISLRGKEIPLNVFFGALKRHAAMRGYKPGWAVAKYREATGHWPNALRDEPEHDIPMEVASWIKAGQIRWAKSRQNPSNQHA